MPNKRPISAIVLSGGGAQAAYEVGVLKSLLLGLSPATAYAPLEFSIITGTSAGSVNAGLLLTALEDGTANAAEYMERIWLQEIADDKRKCGNGVFRLRNPTILTQPSCLLEDPLASAANFVEDSAFLIRELLKRSTGFLLSNQGIGKRALEFIDLAALISSDPLMRTLSTTLDLDRISNSDKVLKISCTNWHTGMIRLFSNQEIRGDMGLRIVRASSAIPGVFPAIEIEGDLYADGGVVMNTPLKPAIDCGADILHVIYTDPTLARVPVPVIPNTASTIYRALMMALCTIFKQDIELAAAINLTVARHGRHDDVFESGKDHRQITIHRYNPFEDHDVGWLSFQPEGLERLIAIGFKDGVEHDCVRSNCILPYPENPA